jgi:hypothetical protein
MYVQRVCGENYTSQMEEETTNKILPKIILDIEKCWKQKHTK